MNANARETAEQAAAHARTHGIDFAVLKDGRIRLADTPGLGIKLTPELINRYPYQPGTGEFCSVKGKILAT